MTAPLPTSVPGVGIPEIRETAQDPVHVPPVHVPPVHVLRRGAARLLDALWQMPIGILAWYVISEFTDLNVGWSLGSAAIAVSTVQIVGETVLVWTFGTTPGKSLVGLKVVSVESVNGAAPSLQGALLRALKVTSWGMFLWLLPVTVFTVGATAVKIASGRAMPWERGSEATRVEPAPVRIRNALATWMVGLSIPLLVGLLCGVQFNSLDASQSTAPLARNLSRNIAGKWVWLHPISGETIELDARWRLVNETIELNRSRYSATFALGDGMRNLVRVKLEWNLGNFGTECLDGELTLTEAGLSPIQVNEESSDPQRFRCTVKGGGANMAGLVRGEVTTTRLPEARGSLTVFQSYAGKDTTRDEVGALAAWLNSQDKKFAFKAGVLETYFWRNELTGAVASLPEAWALHSVEVRKNDVVTYAFVKWRGTMGGPMTKDVAFIGGLPRNRRADVEAEVAASLKSASAEVVVTMHRQPSGDQLYELAGNAHKGRALLRDGKRFTWLMTWTNNESGQPPEDLQAHELLRTISTTLR